MLAPIVSLLWLLAPLPSGQVAGPSGQNAAPGDPEPEAVVVETVRDLEGRPLRPVPVTLSRVGARGDFRTGVTPLVDGRALPAQLDVLALHEDGSIRHALVSFRLPVEEGDARVERSIGFADAAPEAPPAFERPGRGEGAPLFVELTDEDGVHWTAEVAPPGGEHPGATTLLEGPLVVEREVLVTLRDPSGSPHPGIDARLRLRELAGETSARVELVVEASRLEGGAPRGRWQFERLRLLHGERELLSSRPFEQLDRTRFRVLAWTGEALDGLHHRLDTAYLERGGFVPRYEAEGGSGAGVGRVLELAERQYRRPPEALRPLATGVIHAHMPGTGDRPDIGPYPGWALAYLHTGADWLYRLQLHADGNGGGAFPIHLRRAPDTAGVRYDEDRKAIEARYEVGLPQRRETESGAEPDRAHAPSLGYLSYLLTGERYYAEEASFWASYQLAQWPWKGLDVGAPERMQAWGLRHVVDAAFILPDDDPLKDYFARAVCDYADQITRIAEADERGLHWLRDGFRMSGRQHWVNCRRTSSWQYAWVVWSLGNAVAKGFECAELPRAWTAEYLVGLYTSDDEYEAPDGETYRFDPRDAMQYDLATTRWTWTTEEKHGETRTQLGELVEDLDNYGAVWYWTKVNDDNAYSDRAGLRRRPDRDGVWPLNDPGWGHGLRSNGERAYNWHRYGAWIGLVSAVEGRVEGAREAWEVMTDLAGPGSQHGFDMQPAPEALEEAQEPEHADTPGHGSSDG